jgi:hypothetical protein
LVRRLILLRLVVLIRLMVADSAACGGAQDTMVTGNMAGNSAYHGTFETASGIGRHGRGGKRERQGCAHQKNFHRWTSSLLCLSQSAGFVFVPGSSDA